MTYRVLVTEEAKEDLRRLEDFLFECALEHGDPDFVPRAMDEIRKQLLILERNPFTCRIADDNPYERELIIPFGRTGYVALFEIVGEDEVVISAFRHQREDDYH